MIPDGPRRARDTPGVPRLPAGPLAASPALATAAILAALLVPGGDRMLRFANVERREVEGLEADLYRPAGGRGPGIVLVLGALREGRRYPLLERVAATVAGCGYAVLVPELGRLRRLVLGEDALDDLVAASLALAADADVLPGGVGLFGFSLGGSLALLAAADPRLEGRLAFVASLGGYASLLDMLVAATTTDALEPPSRFAVAASLVAALGEGSVDERRLREALDADPDHPIEALSEVDAAALGPPARAVLALLRNRDPDDLDRLLGEVEGARAVLARLSPEGALARVAAPAWVLHDRRDGFVPIAQAERLRESAGGRPGFTFLVTDVLAHTEPVAPGWHPARLFGAYLPGLLRLARFVHGPLSTLHRATRGTGRRARARTDGRPGGEPAPAADAERRR